MEQIDVTAADIAVVLVLALSGLLAFSRGLVREMLAVLGWIVAALASVYLFPLLTPYTRQLVSSTFAADAGTAVVTFVVVLAAMTWFGHRVARSVRGSGLGALDRSLGFLFGVGRGAVLVTIAWLLFASLLPRADHPPWIAEARTLPWIEQAGEMLLDLVPNSEDLPLRRERKAIGDAARNAGGAVVRTIVAPKPPPAADSPSETGYTPETRHNLDRLLESPPE